VAEVLHIPETNPLLDDILQDMPQDDDWDMTNPIQAIYKKKGLKRYKLDGVVGLSEKTFTNTSKETLASTANASSASAAILEVGAPASGSAKEADTMNVKVENPTFVVLQQQLNVVKSGKLQLEKLYSQALDLKVIIQGKASSDPAFAKKCEDYSKSCVSLDKFLQEAREFIYNLESLTASSDCSMELQHTNMMVDKCMAHTDGIKSLLKRTRAMM
jgi:hypothetical protein